MKLVRIDTRRIRAWRTFHDVFSEAFGFPDYYGRNMDAWIDCMTYLNDATVADTSVQGDAGEVVVLGLDHGEDFCTGCPELCAAVIECSAFVNWRQIEVGKETVLALSFHKQP